MSLLVVWGLKPRLVGKRRTSDQWAHRAESPAGQSHGEGSSGTSQRQHTPPEMGREKSQSFIHSHKHTHTFTHTDLDHFWFIQPLADNGLDQREGLLQDNHHLRNGQNRCWVLIWSTIADWTLSLDGLSYRVVVVWLCLDRPHDLQSFALLV